MGVTIDRLCVSAKSFSASVAYPAFLTAIGPRGVSERICERGDASTKLRLTITY